ncbi:MAG: enoyl-CoA hydratase-related protein [Bdellovibrionota bacterium]
MFENLLVEKKDKVTVVTINRPQALNALNTGVLNDLENFFGSLKEDKSTRVIILTGSGDKAFVAGADIKEISTLNQKTSQEFSLKGQKIFSMIESLPQVVIGAINGFTLGGGLELALSCDFLVATPGSKFGLPEVSLGLLPGFGGTQRLSRLVGLSKAREMIFTGKHIASDEALKIGLINQVVEGSPVEAALVIANKIITNGPSAIAHAKRAINSGFDLELLKGLQVEAEQFSQLFDKSEQKEGVAAFMEKRKPQF